MIQNGLNTATHLHWGLPLKPMQTFTVKAFKNAKSNW